uniref:Uncharacterized protein n=1 Tax=Lepeophtheirus salmonis TaxID=72036 RepID=A0A0K2UXY1_LEPSM
MNHLHITGRILDPNSWK